MKNMNLIINTHWDREYRWSFSETQYRLVEAVDDLIDIMKRDKNFKYFHTDSQVSMLDDYIEAKPERADEIKELVKEGRILTGPWYTLPAEYLVSGEALVRNLAFGHKYARDLGKVMKAAYNIFSWGQVSQLPQIYRQFGMDTIIFYRGIDQSNLDTLEFKWKGADGKEALGISFGDYHRLNFWHFVYLPYILGTADTEGWKPIGRDSLGEAYLTHTCAEALSEINHWVSNQGNARDFSAARAGLDQLIETIIHKSSTDELLFLQGFDQENPDPVVTELLDKLNAVLEDGKIEVASLEDYIRKIRAKLTPDIMDSLPQLEGEMLAVERSHDAYGPLYNGVFSARMPIKLHNSRCEYSLINGAEPISAWNHMLGKAYPELMLHKAWKELLKNQQHDGIGGCHVDRVTEAMKERYNIVLDISENLIKKSLKDITGGIDFSFIDEKEVGLALYNTLSGKRNDLTTCIVDIPKDWNMRYSNKSRRDMTVAVVDGSGNIVPSQMIYVEDDTVYTYLKYGNVFSFDSNRCCVAVKADIPQNGYTTLKIIPKPYAERPADVISRAANVMENDHIKAVIEANGTITVFDKYTGKTYKNLHYFEDGPERGGPLVHWDTYERMEMNSLSDAAEVALLYNGPLFATYRITHRWKLPRNMETELKIHVPHGSEWVDQGRMKRSDEYQELVIITDVTLERDARSLRFITTVNNTVRDHRLRVLFPTGLNTVSECRVDSPFDVVRRDIAVPDSTGWYESASKTWPSHSFISLQDEKTCTTVYHKGISEYEVIDNEERTVALTLLRCFSSAGNPTEVHQYQELAQCQGIHTFSYSFEIINAGCSDAELVSRALQFAVPVYAVQTTKHKGELERSNSFITVDSEQFIVTALKNSDNGDGILIRGFNVSQETITFDVWACLPFSEAYQQDLEGNIINKLDYKNNKIEGIKAEKREIVTLVLVK